MALVLETDTELEPRQEIGERHRVLIAAAVAAMVGRNARILDIDPVKRRGRASKPGKHAPLRRRKQIRTKAVRKEEQRETSNHT